MLTRRYNVMQVCRTAMSHGFAVELHYFVQMTSSHVVLNTGYCHLALSAYCLACIPGTVLGRLASAISRKYTDAMPRSFVGKMSCSFGDLKVMSCLVASKTS